MGTEASLNMITNRTDDQEAVQEKLRGLLPEGSTLHCIAKSVSRGNASTVIDFFLLSLQLCEECEGDGTTWEGPGLDDNVTCLKCHGQRGTVIPMWLSRMIADAGVGRWDAKHEGLRQGGHGIDRADHIVRSLARALYGREDALRREWL